jgi:hypothetical protein
VEGYTTTIYFPLIEVIKQCGGGEMSQYSFSVMPEIEAGCACMLDALPLCFMIWQLTIDNRLVIMNVF